MKRWKWTVWIAALLCLPMWISGCGSGGNSTFSHSEGIDDSGYWQGIQTSKYVELCETNGIRVPQDVHTISDELLQTEIQEILSPYGTDTQITDRPIRDGDTVHIDFVGRIDGTPFEGGSTSGEGTDVIIGTTPYIDDFLEQLIGHTPGEVVDVEVTFPDDYGKTDLNGKDAVFTVNLHYIQERQLPELTDAYVAETLQAEYGWASVEEMRQSVRDDLHRHEIEVYLENYVLENSNILSYPSAMIRYQQNSQQDLFQDYAAYYQTDFDTFLLTYLGAESWKDWLAENQDSIEQSVKYFLVMQAIVESADLQMDDQSVEAYFTQESDVSDFSALQAEYGLPYLKMIALCQAAIEHLSLQAYLE